MAGGSEISAVFRGLADDAAQAGEKIGTSMSRFFEDTAEKEDAAVATHMAAEDANTQAAHSVRPPDENLPAGGSGGSPPGDPELQARLNKMLNGGGGGEAAPAGEQAAGGETASAKASRKNDPEFRKLLKEWKEGREFNEANAHRYPHNEVHLKTGKIVDSYRPRKEIVERKNSQLSDIDGKTAKSYIDSLRKKYKAGQEIKDSPKNRREGIAGSKLRGKHILEVPKQVKPVPKDILQHAKDHRVTIRDVHGTVYALPKEEGDS